MNPKIIKVIGFAATIIGIGTTLINDWVSDKKMDERIGERISAALAIRNES